MEKINYQAKVIALTQQLEKTKKERKDKGKTRAKYDSSLPKGYIAYLKRANSKGWQFELSVEQWQHAKTQPCTYCGDLSTGMDRIDSNKGYIQGNMVPACYKCNMMKLRYTEDEFIEHIKKIYNHRIIQKVIN